MSNAFVEREMSRSCMRCSVLSAASCGRMEAGVGGGRGGRGGRGGDPAHKGERVFIASANIKASFFPFVPRCG